MSRLDKLEYDQIKSIINEYNNVNNIDSILMPYHEIDLHNGGWKIIPLSFNGSITDIGKKYFKHTCSLLSKESLTLSIHVLEPGCEVYEHIDDDFGVKVNRMHLNIADWEPECSALIGGKIEKNKLIYEFDTTVPHAVYNDTNKRLIFLIVDYTDFGNLSLDTYISLFSAYKSAGYF